MTIFYRPESLNGTLPVGFDYVLGSSQLLMLLVSSLLNPVVFVFHWRNRKKTTSLLLFLLAFSDFISLLLGIPYSIYNFFRPSPDLIQPAGSGPSSSNHVTM